ncbi:uncharacterized protein LOC125780236 isoform X1 [Bactrocera dorsalis]|uniref:Uncharacterized protein LOC125780236 isoform X1 n=1 Tax=Bactrocera dorsalis TaxID=27457 RepID=A0ABM3K9C8_BACDO|nr:uncharacterized protein LOC125780236 isoform X1 [Bactrocera dorsalis]
MSALARFIVGVTSLIAPRDKVSTISSQRGFSNSNITVNTSNCYPTSADTACNTELNGQIRSHRSSKLKIDTERGNISCSPALLEFSFDSGIGMGSSSFTGNVSVVDEKLTSKTENSKTLKSGTDIIGTDIDSVSGNDAVDFNGKLATFVSIDNGISKYSKEEISWKLRYERLQQCRLILFALDRQQTQYRQLRERLSKIGEGRFAKKEPVIDNICNVCSCPINIIDSKSFITCFVCKKRICHATKCSNFVPKSGRRECQICHFSKDSLTHTQSWITEQMFFSRQNHSYPVRARSEIYIPIQDYNEGSTNFESVSQVGANCFAITSDQKTKIREYVEEVVAKLLGNSLDQIRVTQLSKSENYLPGILNNHVIHQHPVGLNDNQTKENILSEFSEISQARLRNMVESIIAEMLGTSGLTNVNVSEPELNTNTYGNGRSQLSHRHRTEHSFEPKAYQDFLAKAVLNKIADNEGYIRKLSESTPDLSSCNIDINFNMDDRSISPESSLETTSPFNYTDAQHSSKIIKDLDRESTINDYIASHTVPLPDLSTPMTDYEEDDMASVSSSILVEGNWEDNWLFRKKRPSLTTSITGSVGMLVPAPKDDVRAQIGDKTTDEISDLSEIDSDTDDSVQICAGLDPYNDRIVNKHLIGGQNTKVILDELIETASLISNTSHSPNEANYIETRNDHIVEKSLKTEAFNSKVANHSPLELKISSKSMPTSCYEAHTAQESENNPISDQLSSVTNLASRSTSTNIESCLAGHNNEQDIIHTNNCNNSFVNTTKLTNGSYPNYKSNFKQGQQFMYNNNSQEDNNGEEDDVVPLRHFVPGSIAEREYKKWNNAVEMPNNPYTPDALKRRISGSQERFIDLPNISSSTNKSVITVKAEDDEENESTSNIGYKRYSRDYYINADSTPKASPNHQNPRNDKRKRLCSGYSDELIEDTFTKESISQGNEIIAKETPVVIHPTVYLALPAQVVEESASFETLSNQSMNSANTTTSDDSDTIRIYDFKKQTTIIVHNDDKPSTTDITITTSDSVEPFPATTKCALTKDALARSKKIDEYKELYPREILLEAKPAETCVSTLASGPTPKAFKFLQPKRRLIDPSQVLPLEEEAPGLSFGEKAVVEEEVAQVMPSVKALAQAFLLSSNKCSQAEKRWKKGIQKMPSTAVKLNNPPTTQTENMVTAPEMTEDATIASDLSSLETDPSANMDILTNKTKTSSPERTANYEDNNNKNTTNMLRRVSMLKSNIAFFENLKFK